MKKCITIVMTSFLLLALSGCGSSSNASGGESHLDKIKDSGVVKLGFSNEKPLGYKENGELKGEAPDITTAIFKKLGVDKVQGKLEEFDTLIPSVNAGKFDVVTAGMYITPDRCKAADFGEPEYKIGESIIVKKGNPKDLHSYEKIAKNPDLKIAVVSGSVERDYVKEAGIKDSQIQAVPDIPALIDAVSTGRADASTAGELTMRTAMKSSDSKDVQLVDDFTQPDVPGVPGYGAAVFKKGDDQLRKAYNKELKKLKDSGELLDIIKPYGFTKDNIPDDDVTTAQLCKGDQ